jgi:hypothetical protein
MNIKNWIFDSYPYIMQEGLYVSGLWGIKCLFNPSINERIFNHNIVICQTNGQGACYYEGSEIEKEYLEDMLGTVYKGGNIDNPYVEIALLDSIAANLCNCPNKIFELHGHFSKKAMERADIIVNEISDLVIPNKKNGMLTVCNIGVVSLIVKRLLEKGFNVFACDKDKKIIGNRLFEKVNIQSEKFLKDSIINSDIALITGMTLATDSLEEIIAMCKLYSTKIVIFAETGANFAPFYIKFGADVVISEPFPFYTFAGNNTISIFKR